MKVSKYEVIDSNSKHLGKIGRMVGRVCDAAYNDIQLKFDDGIEVWFRFRQVKLIEKTVKAQDENK